MNRSHKRVPTNRQNARIIRCFLERRYFDFLGPCGPNDNLKTPLNIESVRSSALCHFFHLLIWNLFCAFPTKISPLTRYISLFIELLTTYYIFISIWLLSVFSLYFFLVNLNDSQFFCVYKCKHNNFISTILLFLFICFLI